MNILSKSSSQCKSATSLFPIELCWITSAEELCCYLEQFYILPSYRASGWNVWSVNHNIVTIFPILNSACSFKRIFILTYSCSPILLSFTYEYLETKWKPKYIYVQQNFEMVNLTVLLQMWATLEEIKVKV